MDLGAFDDGQLDLLSRTPASALGSCRRKLTDADYPAVLECFKKFNIRYFFYNGGNDSMDTCHKVYQLASQSGYELRVIGIPKTIDNDLAVTDHCPALGAQPSTPPCPPWSWALRCLRPAHPRGGDGAHGPQRRVDHRRIRPVRRPDAL